MASRRRARLYALQALYAADVHQYVGQRSTRHYAAEQLSCFWDTQVQDALEYFGGRLAEPEEKEFALKLFKGVLANRDTLDRQIEEVAQNWTLLRMSIVDRNILRLAAYELIFCSDDIPSRVTLNEAIEIAKKYSVKEASRFVNGILDKISARNRQRL
jgi:transcription antitermination factor NusB